MATQEGLIHQPENALSPPGPMTEEEFVAWCDEDTRAEWVEGEVIMPSPASVEHIWLAKWLLNVLDNYATRQGLGEVAPELMVRFARLRRRRVPDLCFIARENPGQLLANHFEGVPDLIFEIVSPESESRDWREKYLEYQAAEVPEYWVANPVSGRVEAYVLQSVPPESGEAPRKVYRRLPEADGAIASTVLTGFRFRTAWLGPQTRPHPLDVLKELGVLS